MIDSSLYRLVGCNAKSFRHIGGFTVANWMTFPMVFSKSLGIEPYSALSHLITQLSALFELQDEQLQQPWHRLPSAAFS